MRHAVLQGGARAAIVASVLAQIQGRLASFASPLGWTGAPYRCGVSCLDRTGVYVAHTVVLAVLGATIVLATVAGVLWRADAGGALAWNDLAGSCITVVGTACVFARRRFAGQIILYKSISTGASGPFRRQQAKLAVVVTIVFASVVYFQMFTFVQN